MNLFIMNSRKMYLILELEKLALVYIKLNNKIKQNITYKEELKSSKWSIIN